jgi:tetratricopeptide (TPR) repeat protein
VPAYWWLGLAYAQKKMYDEALLQARKAAELEKTGDAWVGYLNGVAGHKDEALRVLQRLKQTLPQQHANQFWVGFVYLGLGDKERAIQAYQASLAEPIEAQMWMKVLPDYDPLRSDPKYIAVLKRLGLEN